MANKPIEGQDPYLDPSHHNDFDKALKEGVYDMIDTHAHLLRREEEMLGLPPVDEDWEDRKRRAGNRIDNNENRQ